MSKAQTQATKTYRITTEADCRNKSRRIRHHEIAAATLDDALYEARMSHLASIGYYQNPSIWCEWDEIAE